MSILQNENIVPIPVSVIIPVFNRCKTIRYSIESILKQTLNPSEIIIIDDCSDDNTAEIAAVLGKSIRIFRHSHRKGAQAARNTGIRMAKNKWIAFQDSDDEWLPEKLERQWLALSRHNFNPLTVVHSDYIKLNCFNGQKKYFALPHFEGKIYNKILSSEGGGIAFPSLLTSRQALESIGLLDENVPAYQEWETSIRLARICHFIHIQQALFIYYRHGGETISTNTVRSLRGYLFVINKHKRDMYQVCGEIAVKNHLKFCAIKAMEQKYFSESKEILRQVRPSLDIVALRLLSALHMNPRFFTLPRALINLAKKGISALALPVKKE